jgi:hypothetical protein
LNYFAFGLQIWPLKKNLVFDNFLGLFSMSFFVRHTLSEMENFKFQFHVAYIRPKSPTKNNRPPWPPYTLIRFGKFEEITVLMEKRVTLTQTQVISTQWTLKRPKKLLKAKFFFKGQIWRPKAKKFKFNDFFSDLG